MMKLEFNQVLDYVAAGEHDAFTREMIERDPDGAELLRKARLVFDVLGEEPNVGDDSHGAIAAELSEKQIADLSRLARKAAGTSRVLGTLRIAHVADRVDLTYEVEPFAEKRQVADRDASAKDSKVFDQLSLRSRRADFNSSASVVIPGMHYRIELSASVRPTATLTCAIMNTRLRVPARALTVVYMPESGPFQRAVTDSKGMAELSIPSRSGTLRFEAEPPLLLAVDVKK